jgi:hypothetical protein
MGRTNPTYRDLLRSYEEDWESFEQALRRRDAAAYERLWAHAHEYADAAGYLNPNDPMNTILVSMLLAHQRELDRLTRDRTDAETARSQTRDT